MIIELLSKPHTLTSIVLTTFKAVNFTETKLLASRMSALPAMRQGRCVISSDINALQDSNSLGM